MKHAKGKMVSLKPRINGIAIRVDLKAPDHTCLKTSVNTNSPMFRVKCRKLLTIAKASVSSLANE